MLWATAPLCIRLSRFKLARPPTPRDTEASNAYAVMHDALGPGGMCSFIGINSNHVAWKQNDQQYPPVLSTPLRPLPQGQPRCRTTCVTHLCLLGSSSAGYSTPSPVWPSQAFHFALSASWMSTVVPPCSSAEGLRHVMILVRHPVPLATPWPPGGQRYQSPR